MENAMQRVLSSILDMARHARKLSLAMIAVYALNLGRYKEKKASVTVAKD